MNPCASVNLVPAACLHGVTRSRRIRRWFGVLAALGLCLPVGWASRQRRDVAVAELASRLNLAAARIVSLSAEREHVTAERTTLIDDAALLRRLRPPPAVTPILHSIVNAAPGGVWLTGLRSGKDAGTPLGPASSPNAAGNILVDGMAENHERLSAFIAGLRSNRAIRSVQLTQVSKEARVGADGIQFQLVCTSPEGDL